MKSKNKIEQELDEKELEYDLHSRIESDYRAHEKYLESGRALNFISGASIGFIIVYFINRFLLGSISSFVPIGGRYGLLFQILLVSLVLLCGYMNMKSMGSFVKSAKDYLTGFWR